MHDIAMGNDRDLRIDFFRGLAICVILIDHVDFNPFANYTYHRFGFSDAAEAFVFLSGLSCGIVYSTILARRGLWGLTAALAKRAVTLYAYYVGLCVITIALAIGTLSWMYQPGTLAWHAEAAATDAWSAIYKAVLLIKQPSLPSILLLYVAFTLAAAPAYLLLTRINATLALLASASVWALMQIWGPTPADLSLFPYFNPMAWQFLFIIGMYLSTQNVSTHLHIGGLTLIEWALPVAWLIVILSAIFRLLPYVAHKLGYAVVWFPTFDTNDLHFKYNLSPLRLIHFMSAVTIITTYIGPKSPVLRWGNDCMLQIGRWSLQTFCIGVILSTIGSIVFASAQFSTFEKLALNICAISLLISAGYAISAKRVLTQRRRALQPSSEVV